MNRLDGRVGAESRMPVLRADHRNRRSGRLIVLGENRAPDARRDTQDSVVHTSDAESLRFAVDSAIVGPVLRSVGASPSANGTASAHLVRVRLRSERHADVRLPRHRRAQRRSAGLRIGDALAPGLRCGAHRVREPHLHRVGPGGERRNRCAHAGRREWCPGERRYRLPHRPRQAEHCSTVGYNLPVSTSAADLRLAPAAIERRLAHFTSLSASRPPSMPSASTPAAP